MVANGSPLRVLLLFSDTGGGHRSAAEALVHAWQTEHPGAVEVDMLDLFRHHCRFPFNRFGPSYPWVVNHLGRIYGVSFKATDGPRRAWLIARATYRLNRARLHRLLLDHPCDAIVSVHPLFNHWINWAAAELDLQVPFITVVTDLYTGHAAWFYPHVRHIIVPTEGARDRAVGFGVPAERVTVRGLPVGPQFTGALSQNGQRRAVRERLGLDPERKVVLLAGGGDGMGPLAAMTQAIDAALPETEAVQMVVIAGRNDRLRMQLQTSSWRHHVRAEGFVRNMPEWMAAADVLVTKAGPGTITEAILSGLPLILMGKVHGQEDGNVDYVTEMGVGVWEPRPHPLGRLLRQWFQPGDDTLATMRQRARALSRPDAARAIARDILELAGAARRPEAVG